jgi:Matrixin
MIHRSLGPSLLCALVFAVTTGHTADAWACLTTTCAVNDRHPSCVRDPSTGCWLSGVPLQWLEPCVSFSVDARGIPPLGLGYGDTEALVISSFAVWTAVQCPSGFPSISVYSAGPAQCFRVEYNSEGPNSNAVIFHTSRWPHGPDAIGVTTVSFHPETGRIVDADIEVNLTRGGLDFLGINYVLTHEAGHFYGLDHSPDASAVMFAQSKSSNFAMPPVLDADDQNAVCLAYPTARAVGACDFEPEMGYSAVCGGDIEASCAIHRRAPVTPLAPHALLFLAAFVLLCCRHGRRVRNPEGE